MVDFPAEGRPVNQRRASPGGMRSEAPSIRCSRPLPPPRPQPRAFTGGSRIQSWRIRPPSSPRIVFWPPWLVHGSHPMEA